MKTSNQFGLGLVALGIGIVTGYWFERYQQKDATSNAGYQMPHDLVDTYATVDAWNAAHPDGPFLVA